LIRPDDGRECDRNVLVFINMSQITFYHSAFAGLLIL